jgi:hypothetical protein
MNSKLSISFVMILDDMIFFASFECTRFISLETLMKSNKGHHLKPFVHFIFFVCEMNLPCVALLLL